MGNKFNLLVAEKVMEWKWYQLPTGFWLHDKPHGICGAYKETEAEDAQTLNVPDYSADIAAAWRVHKKACSWRFSRRRIYFEALDNIIQKRCPLSDSQRYKVVWPNALQFLEIEGFSVAALRAVGVSVAEIQEALCK